VREMAEHLDRRVAVHHFESRAASPPSKAAMVLREPKSENCMGIPRYPFENDMYYIRKGAFS
jgi:hypothetical protein